VFKFHFSLHQIYEINMKEKTKLTLIKDIATMMANIFGDTDLIKFFIDNPDVLKAHVLNKTISTNYPMTAYRISSFINGAVEQVNKDFLMALAEGLQMPTSFFRNKYKAGSENCSVKDFEELDKFDEILLQKLAPKPNEKKEKVEKTPITQKEKLFNT